MEKLMPVSQPCNSEKLLNTKLAKCLISPAYNYLLPLPYSRRGGATWYPDYDWMRQFEGPILLPPEDKDKIPPPQWTQRKPPVEKKVRNVTINFGPQHPAAHGVLRLVLELDGEVRHTGCTCISPCLVA